MSARTIPAIGRRLSWLTTVGLLGLAAAWTLLIITRPELRFQLHLPRLTLALEASGAVLAFLTAALAYLRFSLTGARRWFFFSLAFAVLGLNQLTFGVLFGPHILGVQTVVYFWTAGRVLVGGLLLAAAVSHEGVRPVPRPLLRYATAVAAAVATLASVEVLLWLLRASLPPLSESGPLVFPAEVTGTLPGLSPTALALGAAGTALYLLATAALLGRMRGTDAVPAWLPPGLVMAAFSHIHYALVPTVFTAYISTGDLLRLAFSTTLLVGLIWELRQAYLRDRSRAEELQAAYATERARTRSLEELDRAKAELFAILTHELLHPVAALRVHAVTLQRYWQDVDEGRRRELFERMDMESRRLRDLAQQAAAAIHLETDAFALAVRYETAIELVREAEAGAELEGRLKVELEPGSEAAVVSADRARIMQVFRNLMSNAEKYSDPEAPIELRVRSTDGEVEFSVLDRGPGIGPEEVPLLFQKFSRLRRPGSEGVAGSGLGLYISRRIIEAHGGGIWVERRPGGGSAFRFSLPLAGR